MSRQQNARKDFFKQDCFVLSFFDSPVWVLYWSQVNYQSKQEDIIVSQYVHEFVNVYFSTIDENDVGAGLASARIILSDVGKLID